MNHQPFEEWLLNDKNLTSTEKRDLNSHLRICTHCTALSATGLALRSANVIAPAAGFSVRFQQRLAAQKIAERRKKLWGMFVLILSGLGLLGWFAAPFFYTFITSPVEWITVIIGYFLFAITSLHALTEVLAVFVRVAPGFIPPYAWMVLVSALAGFCLLWIISIWRFSNRAPRGVSA
jgi:hypothetical protein